MKQLLIKTHFEMGNIQLSKRAWLQRLFWVGVVGLMLLLAGVVMGESASTTSWVKDANVSSQDLLTPSQGFRIVSMSEAQTLNLVQQVMKQNLQMALAPYQPAKHTQSAESTSKTKLPETIAGADAWALADKDYMFILEATIKAHDTKTKLSLTAHPVYRIDANKSKQANNTVEIKVQGDATQMVSMGPIYLVPVAGTLADEFAKSLPDAADRAAKLVRAFMYYLDQQVAEQTRN